MQKQVRMLAIVVLMVAASARADERGAFDRGSFVLQLTGSYHAGTAIYDHEFGSGVIGAAGVGYYPFERFGVYLEGAAYAMTHVDPETDAAGGGINLILRYHFLEFADDRATAFIDLGGGLVRLDREWPDSGTHNNFTGRLGLGASYCLDRDRDIHLMGGLRWLHLSNGYRNGRDENPNYDAGEAWLGVVFKL